MKLPFAPLRLLTATCLLGLMFAVPIEAIAAQQPNSEPTTFYERQLDKLAYPPAPNLQLPAFPVGKRSQPDRSDVPAPIPVIPETLTQPDEKVTLVKIRKIAPALSQLSRQLKNQLKKQINLKIEPDATPYISNAERLVREGNSHPDPYALIAAARNNNSPLKQGHFKPSAASLSQPIGQINQRLNRRVNQAKGNLATLRQQPQRLKTTIDRTKVELQSRSSEQIGTYSNRLQIAFNNTVKKPLRNLLKKIELAAHQNAQKLE